MRLSGHLLPSYRQPKAQPTTFCIWQQTLGAARHVAERGCASPSLLIKPVGRNYECKRQKVGVVQEWSTFMVKYYLEATRRRSALSIVIWQRRP
jgi:hypothetical protein